MRRQGKHPKRRRARGPLTTVALLLLGSAFLRIGLNASEAIARQPTPAEADSAQLQQCEPRANMGEMLAAFQAREERIKAQELQIKRRMQALAVSDQKISDQLAALTKAEQALRETMSLAQSVAEDDLSKLTSVYENMKPKDAAALFEQMDPDFSAGFLGRMKPAVAAQIMAGLSAEKAYTISVILAGRNANVPKQ